MKAAKDLWIIGDSTMKELYYTLRAMKTSARQGADRAQALEPFIHRHYNVKEFDKTKQFARDNVMARIVNSFISALNENTKLPKFLVVIPDDEVIRMLNYTGYGVKVMLGKCIHWMMGQIDKEIDDRKEALALHRPGALTPGEPKVLWVKALERPRRDRFELVRDKWNATLEQTIEQAGGDVHHVISPTPYEGSQRNLFDINNNISHEGRVSFWRCFSENIRKFDITQENKRINDIIAATQVTVHRFHHGQETRAVSHRIIADKHYTPHDQKKMQK